MVTISFIRGALGDDTALTYPPRNSIILNTGALGIDSLPSPDTSLPALSVDVIQKEIESPASITIPFAGVRSSLDWYTSDHSEEDDLSPSRISNNSPLSSDPVTGELPLM